MRVSAIVVAAGNGSRMGGGLSKQYIKIAGRTILGHTLAALLAMQEICELVVVTPKKDTDWVRDVLIPEEAKGMLNGRRLKVTPGAETRQLSVGAGLASINKTSGLVLVHDGVRPFVEALHMRQVLAAAEASGAAVLGVPPGDTIKRIDGEKVATLPRDGLFSVQTPQVFLTQLLLDAHEYARLNKIEATDDSSLVELMLGSCVRIIEGSRINFKITTQEDLALARAILEKT